MKFNIIVALTGLALCILIDLYIYKVIRRRARWRNHLAAKIYGIIALSGYVILGIAIALPRQSGGNSVLVADMWLIFIFMTMLLAKLLFCIFDWASLLPCVFRYSRCKLLSLAGGSMAIALFLIMWWGALINRNRISITQTEVATNHWPESFDGFKIVQISDLHVGTWGNDTTFLSRLVNKVNSLEPDMIAFTGDIVNRRSNEFIPMVPTFARLSAPYGVYAILGNHDYGDYSSWPNEQAHVADRKNLIELYKKTGIRLLLNETVYLTRGNDSIALIGVENIGEPPFAIYGDLEKSYHDTGDSLPKILLTHNPVHWTVDIKDNNAQNIGLTLSGHTHAMQIQIGGKTPSAFRYSTPWGLYTDSLGHALNVNRGAGTVGMPMRVGATPEITLITLRSTRRTMSTQQSLQ